MSEKEKAKREIIAEMDERYVKKETELEKLKKKVKELEDAKKAEEEDPTEGEEGTEEGSEEDLFKF